LKDAGAQVMDAGAPAEMTQSAWGVTRGPGFLPNEGLNYSLSPAARHADRDGSIEPLFRHTFSTTFNRKLKMRDTFTKVIPLYNHNEPTTFYSNKPVSHLKHVYPKRNDDGRITYQIDRANTHKVDQMKDYNESMYKITDMMAYFKPSGKK
tara:strand:+ start:131 stop:583 length:453 start_codon:yes stop_codon:yes gene_type:complete